MRNKNFKKAETWDDLAQGDKYFLQEWLIDRDDAGLTVEEDRAWALEFYNANGVTLESGKIYALGFDGRSVEGWWECTESDEEILARINEADEYYGSGIFETLDDFRQLGEYIQVDDYLGVIAT